jgi:hypothetical protein
MPRVLTSLQKKNPRTMPARGLTSAYAGVYSTSSSPRQVLLD